MCGWTCRAPKLMTGCGDAASTHSRAALAQPVDWASMPRMAVSYRPKARYRARMRMTTSLGEKVSPSERDSTTTSSAVLAEGVGEQHLGLVDAAEDALLPREDLHDHDRVEALPGQDLLGAPEVDVRGIPAEDVTGRSAARSATRSPSGRRV